MIAFFIYMLKSSFCLALLYGFYKLFFASTTRFSLNRWILVGGMLTCLLLPFVSLELEREPLVHSPFILMEEWQEEWEQSVSGTLATGMTERSQKEMVTRDGLCCLRGFICRDVPSFFYNGW